MDAQLQAANSRYMQAHENAEASREQYETTRSSSHGNGKANLVDTKVSLANVDAMELFGDLKPNEKILLRASDEIK